MNQPDKQPMATTEVSVAEDQAQLENKVIHVHWQNEGLSTMPPHIASFPSTMENISSSMRHKLHKRQRDRIDATITGSSAQSQQHEMRLKLDRIQRKIHLAAQYELLLLNKSRDLRAKRALLMHQYQSLSQNMPDGFVPAAMPPLYEETSSNLNSGGQPVKVTPVRFKGSVEDVNNELPNLTEL